MAFEILEELDWQARRSAHENRVRVWTGPHRERALRGEKHPVYDFLFTYYHHRPGWLKQWHPGPGVALAGDAAREYLRWKEYRSGTHGVAVDAAALAPHRKEFVVWLKGLFEGMLNRPALFSCFGAHEWAMVYRQTPEEVRHNAYPLRFPPNEIRAIVEASPLNCTHFDAFRFFTAPARPLNRQQLTRPSVSAVEQRGCLHANMDLYRWAFKLSPFTPGELVADCFALARDIREVDMRASPYDLRSLGFDPIRVETPEGRVEYEDHQRRFAKEGEPLRLRLMQLCDWLLESKVSA